MTIELKPEDEKLIEEKLRSGAFRSVEEVIYRALVSLPPRNSVFGEDAEIEPRRAFRRVPAQRS